MNKKHRNKNKSKCPNPVPPQKNPELGSENLPVLSESTLIKEAEKNEFREELDTPSCSIRNPNLSSAVNLIVDVPQKPTRSRNKKNENDASEEIKDESNKKRENIIANPDSVPATIESILISKKDENPAETDLHLNSKKKNKKKKNNDEYIEITNQTLEKPTKHEPDCLNLPVSDGKHESTKQGVVQEELVLDESTLAPTNKEELYQQESQNKINKKKNKKKKKANLLPPELELQCTDSLNSIKNKDKTHEKSDVKLSPTKNDELLLDHYTGQKAEAEENDLIKQNIQNTDINKENIEIMHVTDALNDVVGEPVQSQKKKKSKIAKPVQGESKTTDLKINLSLKSQPSLLTNTEVKDNPIVEVSSRGESELFTDDETTKKGLNLNEFRKKEQKKQGVSRQGNLISKTTGDNNPSADLGFESLNNSNKLLGEILKQETESHDNIASETKSTKFHAGNNEFIKITPNSNELKSKVLELSMDMEELNKSLDSLVNRSQCLEQVGTLELSSKSKVISASLQDKRELDTTICNLGETEQSLCNVDVKEPGVDVPGINESVSPVGSEKKTSTLTTDLKKSENKERKHDTKKQKKKNKESAVVSSPTSSGSHNPDSNISKKESSVKEKSVENADKQEKTHDSDSKKQKDSENTDTSTKSQNSPPFSFEVFDNFEDAISINSDDVNKSFEIIAIPSLDDQNSSKLNSDETKPSASSNPNITSNNSTIEVNNNEEKKGIENPVVSNPKNLLGHYNIPATSNKNDYKKEKNKTPNNRQAKVKLTKIEEVNLLKSTKQSQTESRLKLTPKTASKILSDSEDEEYVYKYSFRKVYMPNSCNVCQAEIKATRVTCSFCSLTNYCSPKHKEEDWIEHQAFCFAVTTLVNLKGLKHIYADAKGISGHDYRLLRMQSIVSCEKILKRKLQPCEQEALLYPRICAQANCREWRNDFLKDCDGCGQIAHCSEAPEHVPADHQQWCKAYRLYFKLVNYQQSKGRIEPKLPSKVICGGEFRIPDKLNELLVQLYGDNLDLDDIHYAALTQLATAPLTAAYSYQLCKEKASRSFQITKKFILHIVGAELQFEADTLRKWETFFLHLRPDIDDLKVVFVGPELNPSKLPLDLLCKVKMCSSCRNNHRKVTFEYYDGQLYHEYINSNCFTQPNIVCAFNPGLHRITGFGAIDSWPETINCILKMNVPFCVTSYTQHELPKDLLRVKECAKYPFEIVLEPTINPYSSVRPDRNFISDDEMPLIFKNYFNMVLLGSPKPNNQ